MFLSLAAFTSKAQTITSWSMTNVSGTTYNFSVTLDAANPNGRGIIAGWTFAWREGLNHYEYTNGSFIMGPTGGTTYQSQQDIDQWNPPTPPAHFFWEPLSGPDGEPVYICDACFNQQTIKPFGPVPLITVTATAAFQN